MADDIETKAPIPFNEERLMSDEFRTWKKNAPFLYDLLVTTSLEWPALSVAWLNIHTSNTALKQSSHRLVFGTHTSGDDDEFIKIADFKQFDENQPVDMKKYESHKDFRPPKESSNVIPRLDMMLKIPHLGEVNRVLPSLHDPFLIASKCNTGDVLLFEYSQLPSVPRDNTCQPTIRLSGCSSDGFSLTWNSLGHLASSDKSTVCIWNCGETPSTEDNTDIKGLAPSTATLKPFWSKTLDMDVGDIDDLVFSFHNPHVLAAACDRGNLVIVDTRAGGQRDDGIVASTVAHCGGCSSVAFNRFNEHLLASGGLDKVVALWDVRMVSKGVRLHAMEAHGDTVSRLHFAPFAEHILGSASDDGKINLWDLSRIGADQTKCEADEGPPELLFVHGGHLARVVDFSFNQAENGDWMVASVSEDNILMVWKPNEEVYLDPAYCVLPEDKGKNGSGSVLAKTLAEEDAPIHD